MILSRIYFYNYCYSGVVRAASSFNRQGVTKLAEEGLAVGAFGSAGGGPPGEERFGTLRRHGRQDTGRAWVGARLAAKRRKRRKMRVVLYPRIAQFEQDFLCKRRRPTESWQNRIIIGKVMSSCPGPSSNDSVLP